MSFTALIPGLRVSFDGKPDEKGQPVAKTISFSADDLKTADEIQAGLAPTQQAVETNQENIAANKVQIAANRERIGVNEQQIAANQQEFQDISKRFSANGIRYERGSDRLLQVAARVSLRMIRIR